MKSKRFLTGSCAIFQNFIKDFTSKDENYVQFDTKQSLPVECILLKSNSSTKNLYKMWSNDKDVLLNMCYNSKRETVIIFFIPETAKYLGITLDWIRQNQKSFDLIFKFLPEKFEYIKQIYNYYLENNMIHLKVTQRQKVYETYLKYRQK